MIVGQSLVINAGGLKTCAFGVIWGHFELPSNETYFVDHPFPSSVWNLNPSKRNHCETQARATFQPPHGSIDPRTPKFKQSLIQRTSPQYFKLRGVKRNYKAVENVIVLRRRMGEPSGMKKGGN